MIIFGSTDKEGKDKFEKIDDKNIDNLGDLIMEILAKDPNTQNDDGFMIVYTANAIQNKLKMLVDKAFENDCTPELRKEICTYLKLVGVGYDTFIDTNLK